MDDIWKSALVEIELLVSKPTFIAFFKNTRLLHIDNLVATLSAPTQIIAEFIEKRYYSLIKKILDKKTGGNLSIVFSAETKKTPSKKQSVGPLFAQEIAPFPAKTKPLRVRKEYTFATFAVSDSNQLAYTAATTVADHPGRKYNPLFIRECRGGENASYARNCQQGA